MESTLLVGDCRVLCYRVESVGTLRSSTRPKSVRSAIPCLWTRDGETAVSGRRDNNHTLGELAIVRTQGEIMPSKNPMTPTLADDHTGLRYFLVNR